MELMCVLSLEQLEAAGVHQGIGPNFPIREALRHHDSSSFGNDSPQSLPLLSIQPEDCLPDLNRSFQVYFGRSFAQELDDAQRRLLRLPLEPSLLGVQAQVVEGL